MTIPKFIEFNGEIVATAHIVRIYPLGHDRGGDGRCGVPLRIDLPDGHWAFEHFPCWGGEMLAHLDEHDARLGEATVLRDARLAELRQVLLGE